MRKCVLAVLTLSMIFSLTGCGNSRTEAVQDGQSIEGTDIEVVGFLTENLLFGMDIGFNRNIFSCSTIAVQDSEGESLFGRNFDWNHCEAMVVLSYPENGD